MVGGESLEDAERVLDYVTQVISIPELKPLVKEIRHYVIDDFQGRIPAFTESG